MKPLLERLSRVLPWLAYVLPMGLVVVFSAMAWGYAKDDSWISFRYARNLWDGHGLVFNPGEHVEGYTNFLWTVLMAPVVGSGVDPMPFAAGLGAAMSVATAALVVAGARRLGADWLSAGLAGVVYAVWPAVGIWGVSGLEQGLVQLTCAGGGYLVLRATEKQDLRTAASAGVVLALACMTRPDAHAVAGLLALAPLVARRWKLSAAVWASMVLLLLPYHGWRLATFGMLAPNTYLVKGGSGFVYWQAGLDFVGEMLAFGQTWIVFALGAVALVLAFVGKDRSRGPLLIVTGLVVGFLVYMLKVGRDELQWFRLFLPVFPFLAAAAGLAVALVARRSALVALLPAAAALAYVGFAATIDAELHPRHANYVDASRRNHADVGKYLTRHAAPGETVAFQDMGSTPFHAPDLVFVDTIGLMDRTISGLYHEYGINPFLRQEIRKMPGGKERLQEMYAEARQYLIQRDPDWVVYVGRVDGKTGRGLREDFERLPDVNPVDRVLSRNPYYYGWAGTREFRTRYEYVKTWRRSNIYWLTLWRRKDHAAEAPAEVVFDEAPDGLEGPTVTLSGGTRFLGGSVTPTAVPGGEVFVDAWFAPAGPRHDATLVDVQLLRDGATRAAVDETHIPGDSLWPASRWERGQVVRDRIQIPLPHNLKPGTYQVTWRLRDRRSDTPLAAPPFEDGRVFVGSLTVEERPWWDLSRLAQTDVEAQRAPPPPSSGPAPVAKDGPTVAVGGDLNLGRRQNAITARDGAAAALGQVKALAEADLAYANLESVVAWGGEDDVDKGEGGPYYYRGRPELLAVLDEAGIDVVGVANNHSGDYGMSALMEQQQILAAMGLGAPGAGPDLETACAPVFRSAGDLVVAFLARDVTYPRSAAGPDSPGMCWFDPDDPEALQADLSARITEARQTAHVVLVGIHWGRNMRDAPTPGTKRLARAIIDAGADGVLGSSAHVTQGIEILDGRPVLYDTGNLLFDVTARKNDRASAVFTLTLSEHGVTQVRATPTSNRKGSAVPATGSDRAWSLLRLQDLSRPLGTEVDIRDGVAWIDLPTPPERPGPTQPHTDPPRAPAPAPRVEPPERCVADAVPDDARIEPVQIGPLTLLGVRPFTATISERQPHRVTTWWRVDAPVDEAFRLNTNLEPAAGNTLETWYGDHGACDWSWPTDRWEPGRIYVDSHAIRPPHPLPDGTWDVVVGLRDAHQRVVTPTVPVATLTKE